MDYTGTIGYNVSRSLADILGPLVGKTKHHTHNSKKLAEEMATVIIENNEIFNSHDVVSLFTNTPIPETLSIIRKRLERDTTLRERTKLIVDDVMELTEFIATTTYFSFRDKIYKQKFSTAMGSPVSPILANLFMEWLEQEAIATVPLDCIPRMWKGYVDDILAVVKKGQVQSLTDHINTIDATGNIKFTFEQEDAGKIPFLDTLIVRKEDGSVKLLVYRKSTHTDQYLSFQSHHPLHQKLGVIRTLLDRCYNIVTEESDQKKEVEHIEQALRKCGYPDWSFKRVKDQLANKKERPEIKEEKDPSEKCKDMVVLPYVKGLTEKLTRIFRKHKISTAVKPHQTLRNILVHPKDKIEDSKKCGVVYRISCKNCPKQYIGETGRQLGVRINEHQNEADKVNETVHTRSQRKTSASHFHKSAISDHVGQENPVIN